MPAEVVLDKLMVRQYDLERGIPGCVATGSSYSSLYMMNDFLLKFGLPVLRK